VITVIIIIGVPLIMNKKLIGEIWTTILQLKLLTGVTLPITM
jgi:hypothetical protein